MRSRLLDQSWTIELTWSWNFKVVEGEEALVRIRRFVLGNGERSTNFMNYGASIVTLLDGFPLAGLAPQPILIPEKETRVSRIKMNDDEAFARVAKGDHTLKEIIELSVNFEGYLKVLDNVFDFLNTILKVVEKALEDKEGVEKQDPPPADLATRIANILHNATTTIQGIVNEAKKQAENVLKSHVASIGLRQTTYGIDCLTAAAWTRFSGQKPRTRRVSLLDENLRLKNDGLRAAIAIASGSLRTSAFDERASSVVGDRRDLFMAFATAPLPEVWFDPTRRSLEPGPVELPVEANDPEASGSESPPPSPNPEGEPG